MSKQRFEKGQLVRSITSGNLYRIKIYEPANERYNVEQVNTNYGWSSKWVLAFVLKPLF